MTDTINALLFVSLFVLTFALGLLIVRRGTRE